MKTVILLVLTCICISCTDADVAQLKSYGERHRVRLYSCGQLIGEWTTDGKVSTESSSDGYYFMSHGDLIRISGTIIVEVVK